MTQELRPGEIALPQPPEAQDAGLLFIGRIETPFLTRKDCPHQGDPIGGPLCRLLLDALWLPALTGLEPGMSLDVLYWLHQSRRDLLLQSPRHAARTLGSFALRSPIRPNPIGLSQVRLEQISGAVLSVRGLDCITDTPLLDLKPSLCPAAEPG